MFSTPAARGVAALLALAALSAALPAAANSPPVVSNVVATQIAGMGQVRITFDVADADGDQVTVRTIASSNNGGVFDLLPVSVSGDCNHAMAPGTGKQVVWNAAADYPGRAWSQVIVKVYASDGPAYSGEMVLVPAGAFTMGGNTNSWQPASPQHTVLLDAYYIDKYEVTNAEFGQFIATGGYNAQGFWSLEGWAWKVSKNRTQPSGYNATLPGWPVGGVSWYEAEAYAHYAGKRLPTEAEWEKAARGDDGRVYPWGSNSDDAHFNQGGSPWGVGPAPVGFYDGTLHTNPAFQTADGRGPYGTFDQAGNVLEWVNDWLGDYPSGTVVNPQGPVTGTLKGIRGGSFEIGTSNYCLAPYSRGLVYERLGAQPSAESTAWMCGQPASLETGFRCAKSAP